MSVISTTNQVISRSSLGLQEHNCVSFIDKALWVFNGNQYVAFVNSLGNVGVGKRSFPSGAWTIVDTGLSVNDATDPHYIVSMGIDSDGFIHIAYGMHVSALNYARSDVAENITAFSLAAMVGLNETQCTYPRFFKSGSTLLFSYRGAGDSNSSNQYLNKYTTATQTWAAVHHPIANGVATSDATYFDNFAVASDGSLHVSFMWRTSGSPITLSNYGYAYSTDLGSSWKQADGSAQTIPITQANAGLFETGNISGLINQNHIDVDSANHPHIAYWKNADNERINYYHAWHNGSSWVKTQITNYDTTLASVTTFIEKGIGRPGILIDRTTDKVYFFGRRFPNGYIEVYESTSPYTSWVKSTLGPIRAGWMELGGFDYDQWHTNQNLYLMFTNSIRNNPGELYLLSSTMSKLLRTAVS